MSAIDWGIIGLYLVWIVWDGIRLSRDTGKLEGYFLASKSLPWWAVGLSVMATQLSAITMVSSTGQGYADGMGLLQQYYALPIAMIIIAVTFVPFFRNANVYTAYEYLERRFDAEDPRLHRAAVSALARDVHRRRDFRAGGGAVGADGRRRGHAVPAAGRADRDLHDVRRRASGGLDRRQADVPDRVRAGRCVRGAGRRSAGHREHPRGVEDRRHGRQAAGVQFLDRPLGALHILDRHARCAVPVPVVLRHRSKPGAALPDGKVGRRGADLALHERLLEDSAPGAGDDHRRVHVRVLPVHAAADAVQSRPRRARARKREGR